MITPRKILVPLDFSDDSETAVEQAIMMSKQSKATLYLLHVVEHRLVQCIDDYCLSAGLAEELASQPGAQSSGEYSMGAGMGNRIEEDLKRSSRQNMQNLVARFPDAQDLEIVMDVAVGHPAQEILREQERRGIDMIIIPSSGTGGLQKLLLGSTAERVVREAHCTVMVIKRQE